MSDQYRDILDNAVTANRNNIPLLDALLAWTQNPTSMSAGYAIHENITEIRKTIHTRHSECNIDEIIDILQEITQKLVRSKGSDLENLGIRDPILYEIRQDLRDSIMRAHLPQLQAWFLERLEKAPQDAIDLLPILATHLRDDWSSSIKINLDFVEEQFNVAFDREVDKNLNLEWFGILNGLIWIHTNKRQKERKMYFTPYARSICEELGSKSWGLQFTSIDLDLLSIAESIYQSSGAQETLVEHLIAYGAIMPSHDAYCDSRKWHNMPNVLGLINGSWVLNPLIRARLAEAMSTSRRNNIQQAALRYNKWFMDLAIQNPSGRYFNPLAYQEDQRIYVGSFQSSDLGSHPEIVFSTVVSPAVEEYSRRAGSLIILQNVHPLFLSRRDDDWTSNGVTMISVNNGEFTLLGYKTVIARMIAENIELMSESEPVEIEAYQGGVLTPDAPYSNLLHLFRVVRSSKDYLWWFDKYFSRAGLEATLEELKSADAKEILILTGISSKINKTLRRELLRFSKELTVMGKDVQLRVIIDKTALNRIHDRWIITEGSCYNIPSIDSMMMGQFMEIKRTNYRPPFKEWWDLGFDIKEEWHLIEKALGTAPRT